MLEITKIIDSVEQLHCKYQRQTVPQPIHVELDCAAGTLTAAYDPEIGGGMPLAVYHGHTIRWPIGLLTTDGINRLLTDLAEDAQAVLDGYESRWDGSNHVAAYNTAANDARYYIERRCEKTLGADAKDRLSVYDASDWYSTGDTPLGWAAEWEITPATTDDELEALEHRLRAEARGDGVVLEDVRAFLVECREAASAEVE